MSLAVNILTYNGLSSFIDKTIESVRPYVDEIVVCDTGSTDGTIDYLRTVEGITLFVDNVQGLGKTWTNSPKDVRLTELLNETKDRTKSEWILKVDDDEVFPGELMQEIILINKKDYIYSVPFLHVGTSLKLHLIKRLFKNVPEVTWSGIYGKETLTLNGKRVSSRECPCTNNFFIHLGGMRRDISDREHDYSRFV